MRFDHTEQCDTLWVDSTHETIVQLNSRAQTAIGFMFAQQTRRQHREYCFMRFLRAVTLLTSAMCTHTLV